ncbi:MAG: YraN family protein [Chitinophagaceae bacterium]|nr:MAG: YraN family protein [Chitinophagaceae bacterium]
MASHNTLGKLGEILALHWLKDHGFTVLEHNWRFRRYELDVVALKAGVLHFVEVKTRVESPFGHPEDAVGYKKFSRLKSAAQAYINQQPGYRWIQYDILAITVKQGADPAYLLLEDVYM